MLVFSFFLSFFLPFIFTLKRLRHTHTHTAVRIPPVAFAAATATATNASVTLRWQSSGATATVAVVLSFGANILVWLSHHFEFSSLFSAALQPVLAGQLTLTHSVELK